MAHAAYCLCSIAGQAKIYVFVHGGNQTTMVQVLSQSSTVLQSSHPLTRRWISAGMKTNEPESVLWTSGMCSFVVCHLENVDQRGVSGIWGKYARETCQRDHTAFYSFFSFFFGKTICLSSSGLVDNLAGRGFGSRLSLGRNLSLYVENRSGVREQV